VPASAGQHICPLAPHVVVPPLLLLLPPLLLPPPVQDAIVTP
jgi:hypothetical protein